MIRTARHAVLALLAAGVVVADDAEPEEHEDELTDMEFLEYLGSWAESDEDWLIFSVPESRPEETDEPPAREEDDERDS